MHRLLTSVWITTAEAFDLAWQSLPPVVRRRVVAGCIIWILALFAIIGVIIASVSGLAFQPAPMVIIDLRLIIVSIIILAMALLARMTPMCNPSRVVRHEVKNLSRVCVLCEYNLSGLSDLTKCPECGTIYNQDRLRKYWQDLYDVAVKQSNSGKPSSGENLVFTACVVCGIIMPGGSYIVYPWGQDIGAITGMWYSALTMLMILLFERNLVWFQLYARRSAPGNDGIPPIHWMRDVVIPCENALNLELHHTPEKEGQEKNRDRHAV